ncbi:chorismate mutase [Candidatus Woesearchaeota archaeon]|nr:chorismate mutase [Candidatus Woesearchaeota archaeon]
MLEELRRQIDEVDYHMIKLMKKRIELAGRIAGLKKQAGIPVFQKEREEDVLSGVKEAARNEGIPEEYALAIFREIISQTRKYEGRK